MSTPRILWEADPSTHQYSNLAKYRAWLETHRGLRFDDYSDLWSWSVNRIEDFWESIWEYFNVISHTPYEAVLADGSMPGATWFPGSTLNYAEHIFRQANADRPALLFKSEGRSLESISWSELERRVASFAFFLKQQNVRKGDRVVAYLPNIPEATIALLACMSIGAVWSSCSPDFGADSVIDRFAQIEPKVLIAIDGYRYGGKPFDKMAVVRDLVKGLTSVETVVFVPYLEADRSLGDQENHWHDWSSTQQSEVALSFEALPFDHPIWVLYSSGTTGAPKAITHGHGGVLLEHFKYLAFHNDVRAGEAYFWFSTTGWMMWNFVHASALLGATIVLYDGSPAYPDLGVLWELAQEARIVHFGTSAPFIVASLKAGIAAGTTYDLSALRSIGSTGSPLPPEGFDYVYRSIKSDVWLCSMSGGTDVCTAFVGGCPDRPVYEGEIQCRALGCSLYAFDDAGHILRDEVGEMVITKPMPSMPIFFWNDEGGRRYKSSYFETYPSIWRHGDWVRITPRDSLVIYGRSDATLNRHGVRIGTSEIYRALHHIPEVQNALIVNLELPGGRHYMPLFVVLRDGEALNDELQQRINRMLRKTYSPRHVPDDIVKVPDIPTTISGKKMEAPVKKILLGMPVETSINRGAMRNPDAIDFFIAFRKEIETKS